MMHSKRRSKNSIDFFLIKKYTIYRNKSKPLNFVIVIPHFVYPNFKLASNPSRLSFYYIIFPRWYGAIILLPVLPGLFFPLSLPENTLPVAERRILPSLPIFRINIGWVFTVFCGEYQLDSGFNFMQRHINLYHHSR